MSGGRRLPAAGGGGGTAGRKKCTLQNIVSHIVGKIGVSLLVTALASGLGSVAISDPRSVIESQLQAIQVFVPYKGMWLCYGELRMIREPSNSHQQSLL